MKLKETMGRAMTKVNKKSPEIFIGVGVAGVVTSCVMACKATLKLQDILNEYAETEEKINEVLANEELQEKYSEEDAANDLRIMRIKTAVNVGKLYLPAVAVGAVSIGCILRSHQISKNRYDALSAAYVTIDASYKKYRKRVAERFGTEIEKELRYDVRTQEISNTTKDENGNEVVTTEMAKISGVDGYSDYARFFDESCIAYQKDPGYNLTFLKAQQAHANNILKARGILFLNEVYEMLDIPKTKAGQVVGWRYDSDNTMGDNYVDFGIYDMDRERVRAFVNGHEPTILLDFNVDGNVWEQM